MTDDPLGEAYRKHLSEARFSPGWAKAEPSLWNEPRRDFHVTQFRYSQAKEALHEAGSFVSPAQAERRNLICVNPKEGNTYATTANLVAAYQMVGPGEKARSHRHTPNALRLILDASEGTYTVINGSRIDVVAGDVVLTPNWSWHGHANDGVTEAYWIDFLDVPFVQHTGPMFFEPHELTYEPIVQGAPGSPMRISPTQVLHGAKRIDGSRVVPIALGLLSTMGLELLSLSVADPISCERSTASNVYAVIEGRCSVTVGESREIFDLRRGDILAVPPWTSHMLSGPTRAVVLRVSDAPILSALGLLRTDAHSGVSSAPAVGSWPIGGPNAHR
jgi:gentisate 1,2-dioxygenase